MRVYCAQEVPRSVRVFREYVFWEVSGVLEALHNRKTPAPLTNTCCYNVLTALLQAQLFPVVEVVACRDTPGSRRHASLELY